MEIFVYDTLKKQKRKFTPIRPGKAGIYVCGVTVYDRCHLGHARGAVNFDVLRRFLAAAGHEVRFVKNYTDIDDKIIQRAAEKGLETGELTKEMIAEHDRDMERLAVLPPDFAPKATEHIGEMIAMIETLVRKGVAYEADGDVLFRIRKFAEYGKLSGKNAEDLIAGARVEINEAKENLLDFVLWKAAKPGEPSWESPWGKGRPGWHIECSAMSRVFLGDRFDMHLGGGDLIFPHHENEIAQSECANGCEFANYWMHTGMVRVQGEKMSKSLGNFALLGELFKVYQPELIRFYVLQTHYRQAIDFSSEGLAAAKEGLDKIYESFLKFGSAKENGRNEIAAGSNPSPEFMAALADDLNTPKALAELFKGVKTLNELKPKNPEAKEIAGGIAAACGVLGIFNARPREWFQTPRIKKEGGAVLGEAEIRELLEKRNAARKNKDYALADELRAKLSEAGIALKDGPEGAFWLYE